MILLHITFLLHVAYSYFKYNKDLIILNYSKKLSITMWNYFYSFVC